MKTLTQPMKQILWEIREDKFASFRRTSPELRRTLQDAGCILLWTADDIVLSPTGVQVAQEWANAQEIKRAKAREGARARHAARTALGLKRCSNGMYE